MAFLVMSMMAVITQKGAIYDDDNDTASGFKMMEKFGLVEKEYSNIPGVSLESGSLNSYPCYRLHRDALVLQPTK